MISSRIEKLREQFETLEIDGFVVPKFDLFMGEYIRPCDERLRWISGFTGSAGFAVITRARATLFVDGRYTIQAKAQCPEFEIIDWPKHQIQDEFPNESLGFDPRFMTVAGLDKLRKYTLISNNPIDTIWHDRPQPQPSKVSQLNIEISGEDSADKIARICKILSDQKLDGFLTNSPENAAWLMNMRGGEIAMVPAPHVVTLLRSNGEIIFFADSQIDGLKTTELENLPQIDGKIGFDPSHLPVSLHQKLSNPTPIQDPILYAKAIKNNAEIKASKDAHIQDAVAFIRFWKWMKEQPAENLDELKIVDKLWAFRVQEGCHHPSFDTISGYNNNGAIVHYRADEKSNLTFDNNGLLLLDSGGQYTGATTDITRTIAIGNGLSEAKAPFTNVLNALATASQAQFPKGTSGRDVDAITRACLWANGMDYAHGTGHGVGAGLSVHEGPQGISRRNDTVLEDGMILSLEPGYYAEGKFGIRLENLAYISENNNFLHFETLTFVPFDLTMIDETIIATSTKEWLNKYHQKCVEKLSPLLIEAEKTFLVSKCRYL